MKKDNVIHTDAGVETTINMKVIVPFVAVILAVVIGGGSYLFLNNKSRTSLSPSKNDSTKGEVIALIAKVGALYDLPRGEEPTVATVSDKSKLQNQPFFARAENGDRVLIYTDAKKAILYRPSTGKIIEVAPLNINIPTSGPPPSQVTPRNATVSIYNGTTILGLANEGEKKLASSFPNMQVKQKMNAIGDYKKTLVVDVKGDQAELVAKIAKLMGGTVSTLPQNEKFPQGDILIIMGQ